MWSGICGCKEERSRFMRLVLPMRGAPKIIAYLGSRIVASLINSSSIFLRSMYKGHSSGSEPLWKKIFNLSAPLNSLFIEFNEIIFAIILGELTEKIFDVTAVAVIFQIFQVEQIEICQKF